VSEPKLISPMLDNFDMGDPISEHNGVRCCPAMEKDSDNKYIVKIISTPASQSQLDALLLSGAFPDAEAAILYFKSLADNIVLEAETLQKLSQFDGFTPYTNWQMIPMEDSAGFDVYLLSEYRNTLQQHLRFGSLTQLAAINLGLDLCAALAACRRSGYLYANLKPSNIYYVNDQGYRIGDIGFLSLNSLKYTSLPDRYHSEYTAPEITDAFSSLNTTIDIYAVGLILYQVFNAGILPTIDETLEEPGFTAPAYADYEMAEIILKACAPAPENRWQDPTEMGQALVAYMQRNGANDVPIVPESTIDKNADEIVHGVYDEDSIQEEENVAITDDAENADSDNEPISGAQESENLSETNCDAEITEDQIFTEDEQGNLTFLEEEHEDETLPSDHADVSEEISDVEITEEVSDMLEQADELIAHPTPDPVVQPEAIDVQIPDPVPGDENPDEESDIEISATDDVTEESTQKIQGEEAENSPETHSDNTDDELPTKKSPKTWMLNIFATVSIIALLVVGFFFYKDYYLQPIESIMLEDGGNGLLTVYVTSNIKEDKLTVICSDTYGNQLTSDVVNGKAVFHDLAPNAAYNVKVSISGFHRLTGDTSAAYTTPKQTNIVQFTAVTGTEDGSVVLGFAVDGPDSEQWKITYNDDNNQPQEITFSGHILTINPLTIGQAYTFTLEPVDDILITGNNTVTHTAAAIVKPKTVMITSRFNNSLTAMWASEENVEVSSWTVRCYGANGFDETFVTSDTEATFNIPDANTDYTVEVTAAGMSVSERAYAPANAITVGNFHADESDPTQLTITWESTEESPEEGWVLSYTINGSSANEIVCKEGNKAVVSPIIPGCEYAITLQSADGRPVLGGIRVYNSPAAEPFEGYWVTAEEIEFFMCRTPSYSGWNRFDLAKDDYTTTFEVGEEASFLVHLRGEYDTSNDSIHTLFVFTDKDGAVVETASISSTWTNMWYRNYGELDIPSLPQTPGEYTVTIYFNGLFAGTCDFTITGE